MRGDRIGHGVRIVDDIAYERHAELGRLAAYVRDRQVPLEMCPASNVQTGASASVAEHPIRMLDELGFAVTVNCDNQLMSGPACRRVRPALRRVRLRPRGRTPAQPERRPAAFLLRSAARLVDA